MYSEPEFDPISRGTVRSVSLLIRLNSKVNQRGSDVSLRKTNMNIVLQSKGSSAFIEDLAGAWTEERDHAHVFANGLEALVFCFKQRLNNMQMVATFLDPRMNFSVPVVDVRAA